MTENYEQKLKTETDEKKNKDSSKPATYIQDDQVYENTKQKK